MIFCLLDLLQKTRQTWCKLADTPIDLNHKLREVNEDGVIDKVMYQRLVTKLIYLSRTQPDIAYAINLVSQFMHNPKEVHLQVVYKILHYLKTTPEKGILFKKSNELSLEAYIDVDYTGSIVDWRSTTRLHFPLRELDNLEE